MTEDRLLVLITHQISGELLPEEGRELQLWADEVEINRQFLAQFENETFLREEINRWKNVDPALAYRRWKKSHQKARIKKLLGWSAAASILIATILVALTTKMSRSSSSLSTPEGATTRTVMPGRSTATLTLGNGDQILLDSVAKGKLLIQGNTRLLKDSGSLTYQSPANVSSAIVYNILTTPRAGQYQLTLPDGSRVWLNNVSSLRYPTSFPGRERMVELTGEAYFEIAKDAAHPFIVKVKDESIRVLGTSFNVMAYPEEGGTRTTLLAGTVEVKTAGGSAQLKPDEQTVVVAAGGLKVLQNVDSRSVISWKDGFFYFGRASFSEVMRQLARWYDIEVVYKGKTPDMEFGGKVDRNLPLNDLLKFLDKNQIHFLLDGRKLIVQPN